MNDRDSIKELIKGFALRGVKGAVSEGRTELRVVDVDRHSFVVTFKTDRGAPRYFTVRVSENV